MMMPDRCWDALGLTPTQDVRAIKQAYLTRLKITRPEEDLHAFQTLRQAYEQALALAPLPDSGQRRDDLPDWLLPDLASDTVAPGWEEAAPAEPAVTPEAAPGEALATTVEDSVGLFFDKLGSDAAMDFLHALWASRQWQQPDAERALEQGLSDGLAKWLQTLPGVPGCMSHDAPCIAALLVLAGHYQWMNQPRAGLLRQPAQLGAIRDGLLRACISRVRQLADQGSMAAARAELARQLQDDVFLHLDARQALEAAWADDLCHQGDWAAGLAEMIFGAFEWLEPHARPTWYAHCDTLLEAYKNLTDRLLLGEIANGQRSHPEISRNVARALSARRIHFKIWNDSIKPQWHAEMHKALVWLKREAPGALSAVRPAVLRWWLAPRPEESDVWTLPGLAGWIGAVFWMLDFLQAHAIRGWSILPPVLVAMALGGFGGYILARLLAWLRVMSGLYVYRPWARWDERITRRMPYAGHWLAGRDIGLTRDLLPCAVIWMIYLVIFPNRTMSAAAIFGASGIAALLYGFVWRRIMRFLADSPGMQRWVALAGVR